MRIVCAVFDCSGFKQVCAPEWLLIALLEAWVEKASSPARSSAGRLIVVVHKGLDDVYWEAERAGAFEVSQLPSCAMDPAILIVWPNTVVVFELNVTATVAAGVAHPVAAVVEVALVEVAGGAAEEAVLLVVVGGLEPVPVILMSAQVR